MTDRAALVEKVGRALAENAYAQTGITLTDPYTPDADHWNSQATAAISLIRADVLEEAARVADEDNSLDGDFIAAAIRALKDKP
jgi:hypothetical protein